MVADASILIHLSKIGRFDLLKKVYGEVTVVRDVYVEVVERGWGLAGSSETENAVHEGWVKVVDVTDRGKARELSVRHRIHLPNAETVQLARESGAALILADEEAVRGLAQKSGVNVLGCLGVLVEAVRRGIIGVDEAGEDAERLVEGGYRVGEEVLKEFHNLLGEAR